MLDKDDQETSFFTGGNFYEIYVTGAMLSENISAGSIPKT